MRDEVRRGVEVPDCRAGLVTGLRLRLSAGQITGANREHDLDRAYEVADPRVLIVSKGLLQFAKATSGLPVAIDEMVDSLPEQTHQQVAAPLCADAHSHQLA